MRGPIVRGPIKSRPGLCLALVLASLGAGLAVAPGAGAYVYWANQNNDTIGRANLDGSSPNQMFIAGADEPCGLALDALPVPPPAAAATKKKCKKGRHLKRGKCVKKKKAKKVDPGFTG